MTSIAESPGLPEPSGVTVQTCEKDDTTSSLRRSGRARKRPASFDHQEQDDEPGKEAPSGGPPQKKAAKLVNTTRRNPQRKAAVEAAQAFGVPDNLLEQALAPLADKDRQQWQGWTDLESEPVRLGPLQMTPPPLFYLSLLTDAY